MKTIDIGPHVRLQKVGDFSRAAKDPAMETPANITSQFPPKAENFKCGPEGTWYATVEELVRVKERSKNVKRPRRRIHWLTASGELRVVDALPVFHEIAFDQTVAFLTADRGELLQLSLEHGAITPLTLEGHSFGEQARLWEIFLLDGQRVVIREALNDVFVLAKQTSTGLVFLAEFPFEGAFTVVGKRFLVGGAESVHVLDLATNTPHEMGMTAEVGVGMIWRHGENVRIYSQEAGTWQILTR